MRDSRFRWAAAVSASRRSNGAERRGGGQVDLSAVRAWLAADVRGIPFLLVEATERCEKRTGHLSVADLHRDAGPRVPCKSPFDLRLRDDGR